MPSARVDIQGSSLSPAEAGSVAIREKKKIYLELIRAFSMLLVIFNHTSTRGFFLFSVAADSDFYWLYLFASVACKIAVPLYWMISGALLLPRDEPIKTVFRRRIPRMVLVLILFSMLYFFIAVIKKYQTIGPDSAYSFFTRLYTGTYATAFWFLYAYIGMLMMLPFLRKLVKAMPRSYFHYLFFLILFLRGILPILEYLISTLPVQTGIWDHSVLKNYLLENDLVGKLSLNGEIVGNVFTQAVLYFLGGYYFDSLLDDGEITGIGTAKWLAAGFAAIVITCLMTHYKIAVTGLSQESDAQTFYNNLVCIPTFAFFYSIRFMFLNRKVPSFAEKAILSFGSCSFGIMLLEEALRPELLFIYYALDSAKLRLFPCIVWVLAVYLCGYAIAFCLKKTPGIKSLI